MRKKEESNNSLEDKELYGEDPVLKKLYQSARFRKTVYGNKRRVHSMKPAVMQKMANRDTYNPKKFGVKKKRKPRQDPSLIGKLSNIVYDLRSFLLGQDSHSLRKAERRKNRLNKNG